MPGAFQVVSDHIFEARGYSELIYAGGMRVDFEALLLRIVVVDARPPTGRREHTLMGGACYIVL